MSKQVAVEGQTEHIPRTQGRRLVRRGWAEWIIEDKLLRRLKRRCRDSAPEYTRGAPYIPLQLPPSELPNVTVKLPENQAQTRSRQVLVRMARDFCHAQSQAR